ncbi:MAG: hypothetical protein HQ594_00335 [Candidatus Omnitrophica bacterium]|nr:hypothetical protein [Candidatus Omnitrophota bacterium]
MRSSARFISCLVLVIMLVTVAGCGVSKSEHEKLGQQYAKVQGEIEAFNEQVKVMQDENVALKKITEEQKAQIGKLVDEKNTIAAAYKKLKEARVGSALSKTTE